MAEGPPPAFSFSRPFLRHRSCRRPESLVYCRRRQVGCCLGWGMKPSVLIGFVSGLALLVVTGGELPPNVTATPAAPGPSACR